MGARLKFWRRSRVPKKGSRDEPLVTAPPSNLTRLYYNAILSTRVEAFLTRWRLDQRRDHPTPYSGSAFKKMGRAGFLSINYMGYVSQTGHKNDLLLRN